jgi:hypothetical protein
MGVDEPTCEIARLKSVRWEWGRKLDEETTARLEKFKSEGLELNICNTQSITLEDFL